MQKKNTAESFSLPLFNGSDHIVDKWKIEEAAESSNSTHFIIRQALLLSANDDDDDDKKKITSTKRNDNFRLSQQAKRIKIEFM